MLFVVIEGTYALSGAQEPDAVLDVLQQVLCGADGCAVPGAHHAHA